jgi:general secretion pathway protein D
MITTRRSAPANNRLACARGLLAALSVALTAMPMTASAQAAPAAPAAQAKAGGEAVMLNFVNAELEAAVRAIGQYTGRQFVIDPRVRGTLTLVTERPVTKQQAYEQLLAALRLQGFTIVEPARADGIARIVPEADAKLQGGPVVVPSTAAPRGDQVVTQVFRLRFESATNLVPVLRPLIAPNNTISAYPANNSLVITDYAENLRRIGRIIEAIDAPAAAESEIVPLKHGLAVDLAAIANRAIEEGARTAGQAVDGGQRVQILAEPRTNSLILRAASPSRLALAKSLIERLDQPSLTPGNINVVYLRNAEAVKLAPLLRAVLSSDPSFVPQAGGPALSGTTISAGQQQPGLIGQQPQQIAPQQPTTAGAGAAGGGAGGALAGMIQPDAATNSLIITAPEPLYRNIRAIIEKLDARRAQVVIESLIVEVSADKAAEFGIQWQDLSGLNSNNTRVIGGTNFGGTGTNIIGVAGDVTTAGRGLNIGVIRGKINVPGIGEIINLGFLARALETKADANILSQPNIQTLDNEEAKFLVGQNVPFVTGSFTQTGTGATNPFQTFERRDVGLQLRVKPQISEGGVVRLALYLEVSSVAPATASGQLITNKRSFESVVLVEDGNFVVLSGLIEDRSSVTQEKVPLLGDLPLIGNFFRYENRDRRRTNTMVFLRPIIVRDEGTSTALAAERYDYMRAQLAGSQPADSLVFRDLNVAPLPPAPEPSAKQRGAAPAGEPAPAPATPVPVPAPAPQGEAPPAATPPPVATAPPAAPASGAYAASAETAKPAGTVHLLQVAALTDIAAGRRMQQDLRQAGFDAYWESVRTSTGEIVRVRIAVDSARRSLADTVAELKKLGYNPVQVQK